MVKTKEKKTTKQYSIFMCNHVVDVELCHIDQLGDMF